MTAKLTIHKFGQKEERPHNSSLASGGFGIICEFRCFLLSLATVDGDSAL
jgi:hypothetical protein